MNWSAFEAFIESRRHEPFAWGSNDCALFAADAVLALTGVDYASGLRGYRTQLGAQKRIAKHGGLDKLIPLPEVDLCLAKRGDPIMFETALGDTLGVCIGDKFAAVGHDGLLFFPMSQAERAWSCHQR